MKHFTFTIYTSTGEPICKGVSPEALSRIIDIADSRRLILRIVRD